VAETLALLAAWAYWLLGLPLGWVLAHRVGMAPSGI
jgi:MATE family multidrug resistance protein